jgi:hypothetical protein
MALAVFVEMMSRSVVRASFASVVDFVLLSFFCVVVQLLCAILWVVACPRHTPAADVVARGGGGRVWLRYNN